MKSNNGQRIIAACHETNFVVLLTVVIALVAAAAWMTRNFLVVQS